LATNYGKHSEQSSFSQEVAVKQYIYVLKLIPHLLKESNWTDADNAVVGRHFAHLQSLLAEGILILAGKTEGLDEKTFGIVIFEAEDLESAQKQMTLDPAIQEEIMNATLFPYSVALMRGKV
jgi:uncharacterized protein YciI